MNIFESLESNAVALAEFTEMLRLALRTLLVAAATLCVLHVLWRNPLKLCVSAFYAGLLSLAEVELSNHKKSSWYV